MALSALRYSRGSLFVLDQLRIPLAKEYIEVTDANAAWDVIRSMQVRGAPLIAIVAALGLAVEAERRRLEVSAAGGTSTEEAAEWLKGRSQYLRTSRPTAVNLFNAMDALDGVVDGARTAAVNNAVTVYQAYIDAAEQMLSDDVAANRAIGDVGADAILAAMAANGRAEEKARVMTICNTGSLATAGWGTALGVVRSLHERGRLAHVFALETRPYNQGARLTAFEIQEDGLPGTLLCDSAAATLMRSGGVDACVVGADRVAANGDTANKIGTYALSVLARHHGTPFFVASPTTTLDAKTLTGAEIVIEERSADEICCVKIAGTSHRVVPEGIGVWNPSFDVAPAALITGIVTERGLLPRLRPGGDFDISGFLAGVEGRPAKAARTAGRPPASTSLQLKGGQGRACLEEAAEKPSEVATRAGAAAAEDAAAGWSGTPGGIPEATVGGQSRAE